MIRVTRARPWVARFMAAERLTDWLVAEIFATSQSVSCSAAINLVTHDLALVTRITAGSETLENHVYDGF